MSTVKDGPPRSSSIRDASSPGVVGQRSHDHRIPVLSRGDRAILLLPGLVGHDHEDPVELQRATGLLGDPEMTDMDRVEGPAQNADPLGDPRHDQVSVRRATTGAKASMSAS